jgi:hypothetical protein
MFAKVRRRAHRSGADTSSVVIFINPRLAEQGL